MASKMGVSIRAYAKHRGVVHGAVQKAIESGRITPLPDGSIDIAQADQQWEQNTNANKARNTPKATGYMDAQILKMKAEATLAQMKVKKALGALVPLDELIVFMRVLTNDLSTHFLSLGRNVAPKVIDEKDIIKITRIIDDEIKRLICEYKNDIENRISKRTKAIMDNEDT